MAAVDSTAISREGHEGTFGCSRAAKKDVPIGVPPLSGPPGCGGGSRGFLGRSPAPGLTRFTRSSRRRGLCTRGRFRGGGRPRLIRIRDGVLGNPVWDTITVTIRRGSNSTEIPGAI